MLLVGSSGNSVERQNMISVNLLKGETYIVVPTSTGGKFKQHVSAQKGNGPQPADYIRTACLAVQSEADFEMETLDYDAEVYAAAIELPILSGKSVDVVPEKIIIYSFKSGCAGVSYAAKNISRRSVLLNIDFAHQGQDIITDKDSLYTSEKLRPGKRETRYLQCFESHFIRRGENFAPYISHQRQGYTERRLGLQLTR